MDYCIYCENTGVYKEPNNKELFDKVFDKYDDMGIFNLEETYDKAINEVGYTKITPCPECGRK